MVQGGANAYALKVWRVQGDVEQTIIAEWGDVPALRYPVAWSHERVLRDFEMQILATHIVCEAVNDAKVMIAVIERVRSSQLGPNFSLAEKEGLDTGR